MQSKRTKLSKASKPKSARSRGSKQGTEPIEIRTLPQTILTGGGAAPGLNSLLAQVSPGVLMAADPRESPSEVVAWVPERDKTECSFQVDATSQDGSVQIESRVLAVSIDAASAASCTAVPDPTSQGSTNGLSSVERAALAVMTSLPDQVIEDWEHGRNLSDDRLQLINEMNHLRASLTEIIRAEVLPRWLLSPNDAFEGQSPTDLLRKGESERIRGLIYYLESGMPI